jgi:uncharacterized protein YbaR (Trm112 family)
MLLPLLSCWLGMFLCMANAWRFSGLVSMKANPHRTTCISLTSSRLRMSETSDQSDIRTLTSSLPSVSSDNDKLTTSPIETAEATILERTFTSKNQTYVQCPKCRRAYILNSSELANGPLFGKLICQQCNYYWYQNKDKLPINNEMMDLVEYSIAGHLPLRKDVFVIGLPFNYEIDDVAALFQDYGILGINIPKGENGKSKGIGFVEVGSHNDF